MSGRKGALRPHVEIVIKLKPLREGEALVELVGHHLKRVRVSSRKSSPEEAAAIYVSSIVQPEARVRDWDWPATSMHPQ